MEIDVYRTMYDREDSFWWHQGMKKISKVILDTVSTPRPLRILDAGCGTGGMFELLSQYGQVWGVDQSETAISLAAKRQLATVAVGDLQHLPFAEGFFDLIICYDVLYHKNVGSDVSVLLEMRRVLKPGGHLLLREPAYNWLRGDIDSLVHTSHRYTSKELSERVRQANLEVLRLTYVNFILFPVAILVRWIEGLHPHKASADQMFNSGLLINRVGLWSLSLEARFLKLLNFPFGLSIICLAKK